MNEYLAKYIDYVKKIKFDKTNISISSSAQISHEIQQNYFIGKDIQKCIKENTLANLTVETKYMHIEIYYSPAQHNKKKIMLLHQLCNKVVMLMRYMFNVTKFVKTSIILTNFKKRFSKDTLVIQPTNVNSGSTDLEDITIWRTEEVVKVFAHELAHYFELDKFLYDINRSIEKYVLKTFKLQTTVGVRVTDVMAEIIGNLINLIIYASVTGRKISELYENESLFLICQIAKIIKKTGFTKYGQIFKTDKNSSSMLSQTTQVFSYYVLRSALQYAINKNHKLILDVIKKFSNKADYLMKIILDVMQGTEYPVLVNKCLDKSTSLHKLYLRMNLYDTYAYTLKHIKE